ncbi:hypothetical protein R6Q57_008659, partial [Mikania cordata]
EMSLHGLRMQAFLTPKMDLGNSNISGSLGPELGELKHLQYLELYGNKIEGKIPKELGNLKELISMDLYGNNFQGQIPKSFSKLKSLRFLRLNNNQLSGPIPRELTTLSNLKVFDVSNNNLCGTIPVDGPFTSFPIESRVCGNSHGLIRKYGLMCCRQCFHSNAKEIGFIKWNVNLKVSLSSAQDSGKLYQM